MLPELSYDQRREGLQRALDARRRRIALKSRLSSGTLTLAQALDEEDAQRIRIGELLRAMPGVGAKRAGSIMERCGIAPSRRVRGLGIRQREKLLKIFE